MMAQRNTMPHMGGSTYANRLVVRLMAEMSTGAFAGCSRLPPELELAERYGVSRTVIRDMLGVLEAEGYVERGRGIGTLINQSIVKLHARLDLKFEYNELVKNTGCQPSTDKVSLHVGQADDEMAERLGIDAGAAVITCEKRILANGKPVLYSIDHLPEKLFGGVDYAALNWAEPVYDLLEEHCGVVVDTDIAHMCPTNGPAGVRSLLDVGEGAALLRVDEIGYYKLSMPILQTVAFYTDFFDFTVFRKKF